MVTLEMTKYTVFIIVITLLFAGFILGYINAALKMTKNPDGIFFVNLKDPNEEVMKLQIDLAVEEIPKAKYLIFKVQKI